MAVVRGGSVLVAVVMALSGCTEANPAYQPGPVLPGECRVGAETSETFAGFELPQKVDLLVVVPDAPGEQTMAFQEALLPELLDQVEEASRDLDLQVGVVSPGGPRTGLAVANQEVRGCEGFEDSPAVIDTGVEDWRALLECTVMQGSRGARRQRVLDSLGSGYVEDGLDLVRGDARQVVLVVTPEDDCSGPDFEDDGTNTFRDLCSWQRDTLLNVERAVESLQETAGAPEGFSLVVIGGPPTSQDPAVGEELEPACESGLGPVFPAPRLYEATRLLGEQGVFMNACVEDFSGLLGEVFEGVVHGDGVTLCPELIVAQEFLEVVGIDANDDRDLVFGEDYFFAGPTRVCPEGALRLMGDPGELEEVFLRYCAL